MGKFKIVYISTMAACVCIGFALWYYSYKELKESSKPQYFHDSESKGQPYLEPVVTKSEGSDKISSLPSIDVKSSESPKKAEDTQAGFNQIWFELKQGMYKGNDAAVKFEKFVSLFNSELSSGNVPSIVAKDRMIFTGIQSYGFSDIIQTFPNGIVRVITLVAPPTVQDKRVVIFVSAQTDKGTQTQVIKGTETIPRDIAVSSEGTLIVSGTLLNEMSFKPGETLSLFGIKVSGSGISLSEFSGNVEIKGNVIVDSGKDFVRVKPKDNSSFPYSYLNNDQEGVVASKVFLVVPSSKTKVVYSVSENKGVLVVKYEREIK